MFDIASFRETAVLTFTGGSRNKFQHNKLPANKFSVKKKKDADIQPPSLDTFFFLSSLFELVILEEELFRKPVCYIEW